MLSNRNKMFQFFDWLWLMVKGNLRSKKSWAQMKECENMQKKRAITDLNAPNGSRDIPFQSQEFGQDGHRHFVGFQPHFHLNMTSQTQCCKTMKTWKCKYLRSLLFDLFETLQAVRTWQGNFASFQIWLPRQPKSKLLSITEKQKIYCLSWSHVQKVIWNNTVWLLLQVVSNLKKNGWYTFLIVRKQ